MGFIGLGKEVVTEHLGASACNTFLENNANNMARVVAVYVTLGGVVTYVTSHFE